MWNDTDFWQKMMKHSNQYDFSLINKDDAGLIYCSKLKMLNFDVPIFNIPSFCEQQTHLSFTRDEGKLLIDSVTKGQVQVYYIFETLCKIDLLDLDESCPFPLC